MSDPADTTPGMDEVSVALNERLRPIKVAEYVALSELGAFENERVELLRGRVVRMAPQGEEHSWVVQTLTNFLVEHFGRWAAVRPRLLFLSP